MLQVQSIMKKHQTQSPPATIYAALCLLVKAHQVKLLAGLTNRMDNHTIEIQRFCQCHLLQGGDLDSDATFSFELSNVRKFVFKVDHEHKRPPAYSRHLVTVHPAPKSVYGFFVTAEGGGNRDLAGKPKYHQALVSHFTYQLRSSVPMDWQEPDLHIPTFYTGPDESDVLVDVW